jgi:hypothetical protein
MDLKGVRWGLVAFGCEKKWGGVVDWQNGR